MFSKETEYALRGLVYIQLQNLKGKRPGADEIVKEIGAPRFFTAKILQRMVRQGFIMSVKGKGGGFYFDKDKPEITIKEVLTLTESKRNFTCCGFGLEQCDCENPCPIHEQYVLIRDAVEKLVLTSTIQSLAKLNSNGVSAKLRLKDERMNRP
jgi:Rrf2 family protein